MSDSVVVRPGGCGSPPEARLSTSDSPTASQPVTFDASKTSDPDGDIAEYRWDFDGDGNVDETTTKPTTTHTYEKPGKRTPTVTVTDSENSTGSATATIQVTKATSERNENTTSLDQGPPNEETADGETEKQQPQEPNTGEPNAIPGADLLFDRPELGAVVLALLLLIGAVVARR